MMRQGGNAAGKRMIMLISRSYCKTDCSEGWIPIQLVPALPARAPALARPAAIFDAASQPQTESRS